MNSSIPMVVILLVHVCTWYTARAEPGAPSRGTSTTNARLTSSTAVNEEDVTSVGTFTTTTTSSNGVNDNDMTSNTIQGYTEEVTKGRGQVAPSFISEVRRATTGTTTTTIAGDVDHVTSMTSERNRELVTEGRVNVGPSFISEDVRATMGTSTTTTTSSTVVKDDDVTSMKLFLLNMEKKQMAMNARLEHNIDGLVKKIRKLETSLEKVGDQQENIKRQLVDLKGFNNQGPSAVLSQLGAQATKIDLLAGHIDIGLEFCSRVRSKSEITFLNREDGSVNFTRNWIDYKAGFGTLGEYWLGLECLNEITTARNYGLSVDFGDFEGNIYRTNYENISIGPESDGYRLSVSGYISSSAGGVSSTGGGRSTGGDGSMGGDSSIGGDSFTNSEWSHNNNMKFTTYDRDNDRWANGNNCAMGSGGGGWWYNGCGAARPTGRYLTGGQIYSRGINWWSAKDNWYSYKFMKLTLIQK